MMGNEKGIRLRFSQVQSGSGSGSGTQVPSTPNVVFCVYDVLRSFLPSPLRQRGKPRRRTTAKYRQGGLILSQISPCFFPSLGLSFSHSRFKIHRNLASSRIPSLVSPGFPCLGCLFVFYLPIPPLLCAFPWLSHSPFSHFTPSKLPQLPCV